MVSSSILEKIYLSAYFTASSNLRNNSHTSEISRYLLPLWSLQKFCNDGKINLETKIWSSNKCPQYLRKILVWFRWSKMHEKHLRNLSVCHKIIQSWDADSPSSLSKIDASEPRKHIHKKRIQDAAYNSCKTGLKQVDYSESCKNKQKDEIQSAYFVQSTFSLFTSFLNYVPYVPSCITCLRPLCALATSRLRA